MPDSRSDHDLIVEMHAGLTDMRKRLFGNGQPGIIAEYDERIRFLENIRWQLIGGIAVALFLVEIGIRVWGK